MKRFAFTLLELVFVIIVIGILAVLAMPNFRGNPLQTAVEQVASHIRYTQHLAMVNDIYNPTLSDWYKARTQISFHECTDQPQDGNYYYIGSDSNLNSGHLAESEAAIDPLDGKRLYWHNSDCDQPDGRPNRNNNVLLKHTYGIANITTTCGATIAFDNLGRPHDSLNSAYNNLLTSDCNITLVHSDGNATITVHPETGYVSVAY